MKNDQFGIDSHKLIYHVSRVADWLSGKDIYPIYMEVSPSGSCNHRCIFCSVDYLGYKRRFLNIEMMRRQLPEMWRLGVKSIMYAGEGEPLLHKDLPEMIYLTKNSGIDVALTTNGVLLTPAISARILPSTQWIKVSCNAGTSTTYGEIHGTHPRDFEQVIANLSAAVEIRRRQKAECTLGMQIILIPQNAHEVIPLATLAREIGLDYLVVKPYTRHHSNSHYRKVDYQEYSHISQDLSQLNTTSFQVVFRTEAMGRWDKQERACSRCLALPFWAYIDAGGNIRGCQGHLIDDRFLYGCLDDQSFEEIWTGHKRKNAVLWLTEHYDTSACKINCRMDTINRYLWKLKKPVPHVNFI